MTRLLAVAAVAAAAVAALAAPADAAYRAVYNPVDGCTYEVWTPMFDVRDGKVVMVGRFDTDTDCP